MTTLLVFFFLAALQAACEEWFMTRLGQEPALHGFLRVVSGGIPRTTALLALKFDFIFFTGNYYILKGVGAVSVARVREPLPK